MKKELPLVENLCGNACPYYKPGKNEDLACRGFEVVARLLKGGKQLSFAIAATETSFNAEVAEPLVQQVCWACVFREHDCDFIEDRKLQPCAGFSMLARLIMAEAISIADIKKIS